MLLLTICRTIRLRVGVRNFGIAGWCRVRCRWGRCRVRLLAVLVILYRFGCCLWYRCKLLRLLLSVRLVFIRWWRVRRLCRLRVLTRVWCNGCRVLLNVRRVRVKWRLNRLKCWRRRCRHLCPALVEHRSLIVKMIPVNGLVRCSIPLTKCRLPYVLLVISLLVSPLRPVWLTSKSRLSGKMCLVSGRSNRPILTNRRVLRYLTNRLVS